MSNQNSNSSASSDNWSLGCAVPGSDSPDPAKCRDFLASLLQLAGERQSATPLQRSAIGLMFSPNVRDSTRNLIQDLVDGQLGLQEFLLRLQHLLNSTPQPCLAPFLETNLAHLQLSLASGELAVEGVRCPKPVAVRKMLSSSPQAVDIHRKLRDGMTALHFAARNGRAEIVRLLLDHGASLQASNEFGDVALHCAADKGHIATVQLLLDAGSPIDVANANGWTALLLAADGGFQATVALLLNQGANIHATTTNGWTSLHHAAEEGHDETLRLLLHRRADIEAANIGGWTALQFSSRNGHLSAIRLLLEHGADIRAVNCDGKTALHCAAADGRAAAVRLLTERGADVAAFTNHGDTAEDLARQHGHREVSEILSRLASPPEAPPPLRPVAVDELTASALKAAQDSLECPVCITVPAGPLQVLQCPVGHTFCSACRARLDKCPICRVELTQENTSRSRVAENMIEKLFTDVF